MAGDNYLNIDRVLDENVQDCLSFLNYISSKAAAEEEQMEFDLKINKNKK